MGNSPFSESSPLFYFPLLALPPIGGGSHSRRPQMPGCFVSYVTDRPSVTGSGAISGAGSHTKSGGGNAGAGGSNGGGMGGGAGAGNGGGGGDGDNDDAAAVLPPFFFSFSLSLLLSPSFLLSTVSFSLPAAFLPFLGDADDVDFGVFMPSDDALPDVFSEVRAGGSSDRAPMVEQEDDDDDDGAGSAAAGRSGNGTGSSGGGSGVRSGNGGGRSGGGSKGGGRAPRLALAAPLLPPAASVAASPTRHWPRGALSIDSRSASCWIGGHTRARSKRGSANVS